MSRERHVVPNRTKLGLDPTRNAPRYIPIGQIHQNGHFPRKYHEVAVVIFPRWANGLPAWKSCPLLQSNSYYRKVSNISRTLVGNKIVDHSDVVGASPVGAAPTTSSFST